MHRVVPVTLIARGSGEIAPADARDRRRRRGARRSRRRPRVSVGQSPAEVRSTPRLRSVASTSPSRFSAPLSRDAYGELLTQLLLDAGVDMSLVRRSDAADAVGRRCTEPTTGATRTPSTSQRRRSPISRPSSFPRLPESAWAIHVGTLALGDRPAGRRVRGAPRTRGRAAARSSSTRTYARRSSATQARIGARFERLARAWPTSSS